MSPAPVIPRPGDEDSLEVVLRLSHTCWLEDARRFLEPALEACADSWARWGVVRYISDDFQRRYRLERALVDELRPFVPPDVAARLVRQAEQVSLRWLEVDRIGRRRGTAAEFAGSTAALLEQLSLWCAEIELAARGISRDALPAEGADHRAPRSPPGNPPMTLAAVASLGTAPVASTRPDLPGAATPH